MDLEQLRQNLVKVSRRQPPNDLVPYAFEKRIMARLSRPVSTDPWAAWGRGLWRAAAPCVAITCAITTWAVLSGGLPRAKNSLATDLESTVLAPLANLEEAW